jgi:DNA-binding transcriptional ArsR family regulator
MTGVTGTSGLTGTSGGRLDDTLAALADPVRRRAIELLQERSWRAGDLARELRVSASRMSQHLRVLRRSGLIEDDGLEDDARVRLYRLKAQPFSALRNWLDDVERFWTLELAAFKAHAERRGSNRRVKRRTRQT